MRLSANLVAVIYIYIVWSFPGRLQEAKLRSAKRKVAELESNGEVMGGRRVCEGPMAGPMGLLSL